VTNTNRNRTRTRSGFHKSPLATKDELSTTHCTTYIDRYLAGDLLERELRNVGFPWSQQGVDRSLSSVGGTIAAAQVVCENLTHQRDTTGTSTPRRLAWGAHVAGGTHHAFSDYGEGFCVFNDIAVAANVMLQRFPDTVRRVLILDLDVHQGNGSAVLFQEQDSVYTFSLHCAGNYFSPKQHSDMDIELPIGCTDGTYLQTLYHWLKQMLGSGNNNPRDKFDLVFFQAGVDVLADDRLGRMSLTPKGVKRRNQMVHEAVHQHGAGLVITMGGGYPCHDQWKPIIDAHTQVYVGAYEYLSQVSLQENDVNNVSGM
jgi:acetoin utilization deacetylase AcuC-like enzyme